MPFPRICRVMVLPFPFPPASLRMKGNVTFQKAVGTRNSGGLFFFAPASEKCQVFETSGKRFGNVRNGFSRQKLCQSISLASDCKASFPC